jgi:hypothetical protein
MSEAPNLRSLNNGRYLIFGGDTDIMKRNYRRSKVQGFRVPFSSLTAFEMHIYEKSVSFFRPNPKFRTKLVIL